MWEWMDVKSLQFAKKRAFLYKDRRGQLYLISQQSFTYFSFTFCGCTCVMCGHESFSPPLTPCPHPLLFPSFTIHKIYKYISTHTLSQEDMLCHAKHTHTHTHTSWPYMKTHPKGWRVIRSHNDESLFCYMYCFCFEVIRCAFFYTCDQNTL